MNGRMGYASTQLLSEESARALVRRAVDNAAVLENDQPEALVPAGQSYRSAAAKDESRRKAETEALSSSW